MVFLSRIYTKTGDDGTTALGDGQRRPKDDDRIAAYGDVDELNAALGVLLAHSPDFAETDLVRSIQNDLFDLGADLCVPVSNADEHQPKLRIVPEQITKLESAIDRLNADLPALRSFVLPGGSIPSAWLHVARTVCRRAERRVVALARSEPINPNVLVYLNRLSDLLFVLARSANRNGEGDVLWKPGEGRKDEG